MQPKVTPSVFYGSAAAALAGLVLGLALHGPWQSKAGGPRFMFSSAAAAEVAQPDDEASLINASNDTTDASLYDGYVGAAPLPVTRLKPDRYPNLWPDSQTGVTQASVDETQRVDADDLYKADVFADDALKSDPTADDELPAPDQTPRAPVRYSALDAADSNSSF